MSRTEKSIKNIATSLVLGFLTTIIGFVAQKVFVDTLGVEYLGLNGLFTNLVAMLAVAELGLGSAIVYHLYAPLHTKDMPRVSSYMRFYRNGYRIIAASIMALGLLLLPFLPLIIGQGHSVDIHISLVFLLFIANSAASYLLSYKRSVLYADQKSYIVNGVHIGVVGLLNALQIWVLLVTQNYYLYLVLRIVMTLLENVVLNHIVDRQYKINQAPKPLSKKAKKDIFIKLKGLVYHKVGTFVVTGSSNVIISIFLGLAMVGLYSNYLLIQTTLYLLFSQLASAIRASIGNFLVAEKHDRYMLVFKRLQFIGYFLAVIIVSVFFVTSAGFVSLWLGNEYVFSVGETALLSLGIYLYLVRWLAFHNFKEAAGIFYEDRFVPIAEAVINIIASVILVQFMGISGVFLGIAISSLTLHAYSYPKFVYKGILGGDYRNYALRRVGELLLAIIVIVIAYITSIAINLDSLWLQFVLRALVAIVIPVSILWLAYRRSDEWSYFGSIFHQRLRKFLPTGSPPRV